MRSALLALFLTACGSSSEEPADAGSPDADLTPECMNGRDDDLDGKTDFPNEPGCLNATDDSETDPVPAPACGNGMDDDGDGAIDYDADPGCDSASDDSETDPCAEPCGCDIMDITATGQASGGVNFFLANDYQSATCPSAGDEDVYRYTVANGPVTLVVTTDDPQTTLDTVVYVTTDCSNAAAELGCNDNTIGDPSGHSTLTLSGVAAGTYFIIVDGFGENSFGDYELSVTAVPE